MQFYAYFSASLEEHGVDIRYPDEVVREKDIEIDRRHWQTFRRKFGSTTESPESILSFLVRAAELVGGSHRNVTSKFSQTMAEFSVTFSYSNVPIQSLSDAMSVHFLPIGIQIELVFLSGESLIKRVEQSDGKIQSYALNILMIEDGYAVNSKGQIEKEGPKAKHVELIQIADEMTGRKIRDLESRVQQWKDSLRVKDIEQELKTERERRELAEKKAEDLLKELHRMMSMVEDLTSMVSDMRDQLKKKATKKEKPKKKAPIVPMRTKKKIQ